MAVSPAATDRLANIMNGGFSTQNAPPPVLGSPSDRGPKPVPPITKSGPPGRIGMAIKKKVPYKTSKVPYIPRKVPYKTSIG